MSNIPVIDRVTPEQWNAVFADQHLSEAYRSKNNNKQELTNELTNRIKIVCEQRLLPFPKKIIFTSQSNKALQMMPTGELHVHPLTLVACKLERSAMNPKQQAIYKRLEEYISANDARTMQFVSVMENMEKTLPSTQHNDAARRHLSALSLDMSALVKTYRSELLTDIKDYKYVLPRQELDYVLLSSLVKHKGLKFDKMNPTVTKLANIALSALSAYKVGGALGNWGSTSMYWPVAVSTALLAAALTYKSFNQVVYTSRALNFIVDKDARALFSKPFHTQPADTKILLSKMELERDQALLDYLKWN